jgi:hypothetical protein
MYRHVIKKLLIEQSAFNKHFFFLGLVGQNRYIDGGLLFLLKLIWKANY